MSSAICFNLDQSKILLSGNGLKDLPSYLSVYINHRPAFGLSPEKLVKAFETLGFSTDKGVAIERGDLLEMLQTKGRPRIEKYRFTVGCQVLTHSHTMTPFDAPGKQAF